jgi:hypothetical protein
MRDLEAALGANRAAVTALLAAADAAPGRWSAAPAPGRWSPAQIVEHVARALEESAHVVAGRPSRFPILPAFLRPVARGLFFNRVLKRGTFPRARTSKPFDPATGPPTPAEGRVRLETALGRFEEACRAHRAPEATMTSTIFGTVRVSDYVRFQELHTRHHERQLARALST